MKEHRTLLRSIIAVMPRMAIETLIAIVLADALTAATTWALLGYDEKNSLPAREFWTAALAISTIVTSVITPIFAGTVAITLLQLREARDELTSISQRDPLTGLLNRRGFDLASARAFAEARRTGAPLAALMCDIDFFKTINDQFGHEFGDYVLTEVASVIRETIGKRVSALGRHGGEEFAILLPSTGFEEARAIAESVRLACATHVFTQEGVSTPLTISIGIAVEAPNATEIRGMFGRADAALYQAKREGRNRIASAEGARLAHAS